MPPAGTPLQLVIQPHHTRRRCSILAPTSGRRRPPHCRHDGLVGEPKEALALSGGGRSLLAAVKGFCSSFSLLSLLPLPLPLLLLGGVRLQEAVVVEAVQCEVELLRVSKLELHRDLEEEP